MKETRSIKKHILKSQPTHDGFIGKGAYTCALLPLQGFALDKLLGKCAFCIAKVGVLIESSASQSTVLRCSVKTQV